MQCNGDVGSRPDRGARGLRAVLFLMAAMLGSSAGAQLLDSTLDEVLNDAIDEQVEQQLEDEITDAVEQQVGSVVESAVEQQVEDAVTSTLVEQVEAGVTETVQQQIESGVTGTIAQQLQSTVERAIEGDLEDVVGDGLEDVVEGGLRPLVRDTVEGVGQAVERTTGGDLANDSGAPAATATFVAGVDAVGRAAEGQVWVILVPAEQADRIAGWGFNIRLRQELAGLNRVLLRVDAPGDRDIAQAALELALDAPGTLVDFNHVYTPSDDAPGDAAAAAGAIPRAQTLSAPRPALTIGIVDSAVATEHAAFEGAEIVQRDFVPFAAPRPLAHGTAVASILVGKDGVLRHSARTRLHAATVFFSDATQQPIATTESLVAALAWHAAESIQVVNMSLAGPPNLVLEAAIAAAAERGTIVVAAVGNNGPAGEPLYPAAYASVVGVTAVDSANRIYRYANRGRHVMFAAPGVRVRIADSGGGYATQSGTSMAAPYAAAVIARAATKSDAPAPSQVIATLQATALDLGTKDFDDVFGYGLIANDE